MDLRTVGFYDAQADAVDGRYAATSSTAAAYFGVSFVPGSRVLDVGCGSGRDLKALIDCGYDAAGVDASVQMRRVAEARYRALAGRITIDSLPNLATIGDASIDGLLCWAVLMHVPEESLFDTAFNLRRVLKPGGRLLLSTPLEGPAIDPATKRDEDGRLFNQVTPENLHFLLERVGFQRLNRWDTEDSLGREHRRWATQLFVLQGAGSRSLEKIEAILNRDKKDATYKPALFRALAELATSSYHAARWLPEDRVAIPLRLIADKWLEYFWPLFESTTFIPQKRGERPGCGKPVAFRAELEELIRLYRGAGGLCGFTVDYRSNELSLRAVKTHRRVLARLCDTIRAGPVYYAGGGGSGTFTYDVTTRSVVLDADLWRELSMMGNWIANATVLHWAELTAEISQGALRPSQVIDQLLAAPIPERDVGAARSLYAALAAKVCVWTDRDLRESFEVDHAIPFALWRNNDLWNLLPASRCANNDKRDRLPTRSLFKRRKDCIVGYWTLMREGHPDRFVFEIGRLLGPEGDTRSNWENRLFNAVSEAIEYTAIQRGVERWEPGRESARRRRSAPVHSQVAAAGESPGAHGLELILLDPSDAERFTTCVPFYEPEAAAGNFGPEQPAVDSHDHHAWIRVTGRRVTRDMFSIRVRGHSMEPLIPDGSCCLFRGGEALAGSRQGRIVLVSLRTGVDPETGGQLTVKRYSSDKVVNDEGEFRHRRIVLEPLNPDFSPIVIETADAGALKVVAEFVAVLGAEGGIQNG
ncbi:MAG TPA: methyltransferase domain-containing protein [Verrucomicrobiota bacterium]|nr:methyltransferase domain-containing protein [Verrucomicrobiota bacterium]HNU52002.1 methyltransferase domain-containing protein [Verrucomicrobiota bacterium]